MTDTATRLEVPAELAGYFRHALAEELAWDAEHVEKHRKKLEGMYAFEYEKVNGAQSELADAMEQLDGDVTLFARVGLTGDGPVSVPLDALTRKEIEAYAHACEAMATKVIGPQVAERLDVSPMDEGYAARTRPLLAGLGWAIDQAEALHAVASVARAAERRDIENRLAELTEAAGMTRQEVAAKVGVDAATVERWEGGEVEVPAEHRAALAALFAVSEPFLMGEE